MKLVRIWVVCCQVRQCFSPGGCLRRVCVTVGALYILKRAYVDRRPVFWCSVAYGATIYFRAPRMRALRPPGLLKASTHVPVPRSNLWFYHDTCFPSYTWPITQSGLLPLGTILTTYSFCMLVVLVDIQRTAEALRIR